MFAGQVTTGAWLSVTITLKVQVDVLPQPSVAVATTAVVPTAKKLPEARVVVTVAPEQLSVAVTLNVTFAPHWPGAAVTQGLAGQVITGAKLSITVIVWVVVPTTWPLLVAVQVRMIV
jgi:hypothetical protein